MTDTIETTAPANVAVNLFAVGVFDNVETIASALATGRIDVVVETTPTDGDAIAQWGQLDSALDTIGTDFSKNVRNAGLILYVTRCLEDSDAKVTREAIAAAVATRPEWLAANPDPADPTRAATHAFTRGFALAMLTEYGTKAERKALQDTPSLTVLGAASRWGKDEVTKNLVKLACEKARDHMETSSAGKTANKGGRPAGGDEDASATAKQLETAKAENKALSETSARVAKSHQSAMAVIADVLATLRNESLSDQLARSKAIADLEAWTPDDH